MLHIILILLFPNVNGAVVNDTKAVEQPAPPDSNLRLVGERWPMGVVRYSVDPESYDDILKERLQVAMKVIEQASCVKFESMAIDEIPSGSWINITSPRHARECAHVTEKRDGEVILVLGYDCLKKHQLIHSLLHALGLKDEVTHPHRDQYIRVAWDNILPEYRHYYRIQQLEARHVTPEYDPTSIMHFHDRAYSRNGQATIVPLMSGLTVSPSNSLSQLDKMKLDLMFGQECNKRKVGSLLQSCKNALLMDEKNKNTSPRPDEDKNKQEKENNEDQVEDDTSEIRSTDREPDSKGLGSINVNQREDNDNDGENNG